MNDSRSLPLCPSQHNIYHIPSSGHCCNLLEVIDNLMIGVGSEKQSMGKIMEHRRKYQGGGGERYSDTDRIGDKGYYEIDNIYTL